ncbi:hypothetical protein NDU88_005558 [Pleurodeles waltl]|uniref:Uncharacterized protein n=1 Tax=Pleurodeles waltl TaxID=8319 RepID=A0AAV7RLE6_PLEWA|nr:hypothetical protein NDU88_005558 [Pleurodeles waltl]
MDNAMERILQEISVVGHRLEAVGFEITDLSADSKSIRADIVGLQDKVMDLDHHLLIVENKVAAFPDNQPEL